MKKNQIVVVLVMLALVGGYFGYLRYDHYKLIKTIKPNVMNTSLLLSNSIRHLGEESSKIELRELYPKMKENISAMDKPIQDVQRLATSKNKGVIEPVILYMKTSQDLLRSIRTQSESLVVVLAILDRSQRALEEHNRYRLNSTLIRLKIAYDGMPEAQKKAYRDMTDVIKLSNKMKEAHAKIATLMPTEALVDLKVFDSVIKNIEKFQANFPADVKD